MVKGDSSDIVSALSKNLKNIKSPTLRITFKRGGLWRNNFAKAHSRKAKKDIKHQMKIISNEENKEWPLLVKYKQNQAEDIVKINCLLKQRQSVGFISSLLSIFRANFFKRKDQNEQAHLTNKTKPNPYSKTSQKKEKKTIKNRERNLKRKNILKNKKINKKIKK